MKYDKLVRDSIPEIITRDGKVAITYVANDEEYFTRLKQKLEEEVKEFQQSGSAEELADVMEVVYALGDYLGVPKERLEDIRNKKCEERGGFKGRIVLVEVKEG
ncbi:nucleoside triphosphate pyrophosphohydrolase [Candidatus Woesearchaeota archaeon]|nr:nucleoside triphosphate pyrophosphohydrolase [Candidatus Woesearchaeota archaeon]